MCVKDSDFDIQTGGQIWLDKFLQIYIGVDSIRTRETIWFNMGIYLINSPSFNYDSETNTLSFEGLDLMSKLTGVRNGYLEGIPYIIPQDSDIKEVIIAILKQSGFNRYIIDIPKEHSKTPYEIKIDLGGTIYDVLRELRDIYSPYQIYFDEDGVFHYERVPNGVSEVVVANDYLWKQVYLSHTNQVNFENVKNVIEVLGKSYSVEHYGMATVNGNNYVVNVPSISTLANNMLIGFTAPSIVTNPNLQINSLTAYPIVNEDGTSTVIPKDNQYYVVKYKDNKFYFLGYQQPYAVVKDINPESPYYINGSAGEVRIVLYGGEYDNIPSNKLAEERANYELYLRARVTDSLDIECIPIYWLNVNTLIEFTLPNGVPQQYMIQSINTTLGYNGTQTINCSRYYPLYPVI